MESQSSKIEEIIDTTQEHPSDSEEEVDIAPAEQETTPSTSSKKKKKKKSKAAKALAAIRGRSEIPQELVDHVLDKVKADGAVGSDEANEDNVRQALEQMKIMDVVKGKAGLGGHNKKDMGAHKVSDGVVVVVSARLILGSSGQHNLSRS
jgi:glycylpeptide N-tetradecanoyltransferase